jgi:ribosome biogenesis GTPase A
MRKRWVTQCTALFDSDLALMNILRLLRERQFNTFMEVRDARAPKTCSQPLICKLADRARTRIMCYTHADVLGQDDLARVLIWTERSYGPRVPVFFLNLSNAKHLTPRDDKHSFRALKSAMEEACTVASSRHLLVCGLPNVGKSSLILPLTRAETIKRRKKRAYHLPHIADVPGETKGTKPHCFKDSKPELFMIDTPGLGHPVESFARDRELYYKLMLLNTSKKSLEHDPVEVADYLLWKCNRAKKYWYVDSLELEGPTDDIAVLLRQVVPSEDPKARRKAAETFLRFCHQHGVVNMPLDDLRLTPEEEARVGRVPMNYDPDQLVIATNYTPGMMAN